MGGTKIFVFHLKELIKTAIFAAIGLLLIIALIYFFLPGKSENFDGGGTGAYSPGTYAAEVDLESAGTFKVVVTVSANAIEDISLAGTPETVDVFYPLIKPAMDDIAFRVMSAQSLNVQLPKENEITSSLLLGAVKEALNSAAIPAK
jgi:uncharacterized protein with FMN-binding domain